MGLLVDGTWYEKWDEAKASDGRFVRKDSQFRHWITKDGEAGPTGKAGFKAEKGRYHLYVSHACPWANRTLIMRKLKGLEDFITVSVVNPLMLENGWTFAEGEGVVADPIIQADYLHEIYTLSDPNYSGNVTVPVLFDKQTKQIVNNESADIIRILNSAFDEIGAKAGDYYPEEWREDIDAINAEVYDNVNNGVYKAGFATKQSVYEEEVEKLFETLDKLENHLQGRQYLVADQLTEADIRLFTTLIRFDVVYYGHFKCNIRHIQDYPNLWLYTRRLYAMPEFSETIHFDHIKNHYYQSHPSINPNRIVPAGPDIDFSL